MDDPVELLLRRSHFLIGGACLCFFAALVTAFAAGEIYCTGGYLWFFLGPAASLLFSAAGVGAFVSSIENWGMGLRLVRRGVLLLSFGGGLLSLALTILGDWPKPVHFLGHGAGDYTQIRIIGPGGANEFLIFDNDSILASKGPKPTQDFVRDKTRYLIFDRPFSISSYGYEISGGTNQGLSGIPQNRNDPPSLYPLMIGKGGRFEPTDPA